FVPKGDLVIYDFESPSMDWDVPQWAEDLDDHVVGSIERSEDFARNGKYSLKVNADFPGKMWTAAVIEVERYYDWGQFARINCYIYLPEDAPKGLKGKMILTVGDEWRFVEMKRSAYLMPGKWNLVSAELLPGSEDWKINKVDDNFRRDVRKFDIRVESNKSPVYAGPVYIDDVMLTGE
ncbi:hypothetical protein ACFL3N_01575, partial [Candidatus Omnitrophota bacterium]